MFDITNHFLDTNVLIGNTVRWDATKQCCKRYFHEASSHDCSLHISCRVYDEAKRVIERCRRMVKQVIEHIRTEYHGSPLHFKQSMSSFIESQLHHASSSDISAVTQYILFKATEVRSFIEGAVRKKEMFQEVKEDFKAPLDFLQKVRAQKTTIHFFDERPNWYNNAYPKVWNKLNAIMKHASDRNIALDAYYLHDKEEFPEIVLVSLDEDFVDSQIKSSIEECLPALHILDVSRI